MSKKLTLSAALSVLVMASYVLFGTSAAQAPVGDTAGIAARVSETSAPSSGSFLSRLR